MDQNTTISKTEQEGISFEVLMIYIRKVLKKWWVVVLSAVLLAVAGFTIAKLTYTPQYTSQIMFVASNKDTSLIVSGQSNADITELTTKVANNCGYKVTADQIKSFVSVQSVEDTSIIYLTVTTTDPEVSFAIANTYMRFYEGTINEAFPSTTLKAIDPPLVPAGPNANSNTLLYTGLGFMIGVIL